MKRPGDSAVLMAFSSGSICFHFAGLMVFLLLILPDTGFHQTLNQRLAPQVAGHEFL
jgi:hypothetical protein